MPPKLKEKLNKKILTLDKIARPSALVAGDKKVGVPSIVVIMGFNKPPFSNSWADIFLTGVVAPKKQCNLFNLFKKIN